MGGEKMLEPENAVDAICPHLGRAWDSWSYASYPSWSNRCFKSEQPARLGFRGQQTYCLQPNHQVCPVFNGKLDRPPLPGSAARGAKKSGRLKILLAIGVGGSLFWLILELLGKILAAR